MVLNYEINDHESFVNRIKLVEEMMSSGDILKPEGYIANGVLTREQAIEGYNINKKIDDKKRKKHKIVEKIVELPTYFPTDILFDTAIKLMDIFSTDELLSSDFEAIYEKSNQLYEKYFKVNELQDEKLN